MMNTLSLKFTPIITAGLLPPIVNAGMLIAYSLAYAPKEKKADFYEMGNYAILFYFSHVVTIVIVANIVFWLKDIDPRFRDGEDASFDDIPSLVEHKKRLEASGVNAERARAAYFVNHIKVQLYRTRNDHLHLCFLECKTPRFLYSRSRFNLHPPLYTTIN